MILKDIKRYLQQQRQATLGEIALHCGSEPSAVQGMMDQWIRKGKVRSHLAPNACGNRCGKCDPAAIEVYEWLGESEAPQTDELHVRPVCCDH